MSFIRSLAASPQIPGDFTDEDASGRTRQVKIVGRYAITFWVDEPAKAVMVVAVKPADR